MKLCDRSSLLGDCVENMADEHEVEARIWKLEAGEIHLPHRLGIVEVDREVFARAAAQDPLSDAVAVEPKSKADQDKLSSGLQRLAEDGSTGSASRT